MLNDKVAVWSVFLTGVGLAVFTLVAVFILGFGQKNYEESINKDISRYENKLNNFESELNDHRDLMKELIRVLPKKRR